MQFHAPVKVNDGVSIGSAIIVGWCDMTLDEEHEAECKSEGVHGRNNLSEFIIYNGGTDDIKVCKSDESDESEYIALHAVGLVHGNVPLGCHGRLEVFAGHVLLKKEFECHEPENHFPNSRISGCRPNVVNGGEQSLTQAELGEGEEVPVHVGAYVEEYDGECGGGCHEEDGADCFTAGEDSRPAGPVA